MDIAVKILAGLIALLHFYIMYFEIFAWEQRGPKVFKSFPKDLFRPTKAMAANQGIYNGFLAAGLVWFILLGNQPYAQQIGVFFLSCVIIAGVFGAITASKRIFYIQALPAIICLALLLLH